MQPAARFCLAFQFFTDRQHSLADGYDDLGTHKFHILVGVVCRNHFQGSATRGCGSPEPISSQPFHIDHDPQRQAFFSKRLKEEYENMADGRARVALD
jgi:hypothetical protein